MSIRTITGATLALCLAACSSSSGGDTTNTGGAAGSSTAAGGSGGAAGSGAGGMAGAGGTANPEPVPMPKCPKSTYKTLVIVGDSISDVGGTGPGQEPFYRTLLVHNDDTLYPAFKGFDLATCWGLTDMNVVKVSVGGAIASETPGSKQSILLDQVKSIPTTLTGPVLVVGTIGGNDVTAGLKDYLIGTPDTQKMDLDVFLKGFDDAMAELTKADRFGPGVKADVLMTNIYDPSGGSGDFTYEPAMKKCSGALGIWPPKTPTDTALSPWNTAMATEAAKYPGVHLLDLHGKFVGHEVSQPDPTNWFHDDCIHPNSLGQEHIRQLFWSAIEALLRTRTGDGLAMVTSPRVFSTSAPAHVAASWKNRHRVGKLSGVKTCFEVTDEIVEAALRPSRDMGEPSPRERVFQLLDHMAAIAKPKQGAARMLRVLARMAACDWVDGELDLRVVAHGDSTALELYVNDGLSVTKMRDALEIAVPYGEISKAMAAKPELLHPLVVMGQVGASKTRLMATGRSGPSMPPLSAANADLFSASPLPPVRQATRRPPKSPPIPPPRARQQTMLGVAEPPLQILTRGSSAKRPPRPTAASTTKSSKKAPPKSPRQ